MSVWNAALGFTFISGLVAIAFGMFIITTSGNSNAVPLTSVLSTPTPESTAIAPPTQTPISTPTPDPTATVAPSSPPGQPFHAQLAAWSDITSEWLTTALDQLTSGYRAGEFVPLLLRIDDAKPGTTYDLQLTYDCLASGTPAFDFVGGIELDQTALLQALPGPGSGLPDSVLSQPDDLSLDIDIQHGRFLAWGAAFSHTEGPLPQTECKGTKTVDVSLLAQDDTVILILTGHLASPADWGEGNDAASAAPFSIEVEINGWSLQSLTMLPGSVTR